MNKFSVPATIKRISTLADGGVSLSIHTQDLTKEDKVAIMEFDNSFGYLLFSSQQLEEEDIPKEKLDDQRATSSQRLRNTLFVLWKQQGGEGDFEAY